METITKIDIRRMKADIKTKVEEQKFYRNQRKTVHLIGERVITPSEAQWKHQANRHNLRIMYATYGLARGKQFSQIENTHKEDPHPLTQYQGQIDKILEKYTIEVPIEVQE